MLSSAGAPENSLPLRIIIHGYNPNENISEGGTAGKLVHLPDSMEDLFSLACNS